MKISVVIGHTKLQPFFFYFVPSSSGTRFTFFNLLYMARVLSWGFRLWVSTSVKHLETILVVNAAIPVSFSELKGKNDSLDNPNGQNNEIANIRASNW